MWGSTAQELHFGDYTLDQSRYRLQRGAHQVRLEKLPMELLLLLVERRGELVSREEIAERLWGKDVFLDIDHSINTAVRKIRRALRDDPEKPRFLETVVGKGYRFTTAVTCNNGSSHPEPQPPSSTALVSPAPAASATKERSVSDRVRILLSAVALLALITVAVVLNRGRAGVAMNAATIRSIAVLPLNNLSGDPAQEYFADGMTEAVTGRLSMIRGLRVISRTSAMRFKNTPLSVPEIAKALHADAVVEGSVIRDGDRVRVHAQLIRAATDEHVWAESYDRELRDILSLQSDVAQAIASKVEVTVSGEEQARLVAARHVSPDVYESYLKGRFARDNTKAEVEQSIAHFEQAIRKDPSFAPAYAGLAEAYDSLSAVFIGAPPAEARGKVIDAARKALELDPNLGEAHALLASVYQTRWQWADAEAEYKRGLQLNPNDAVLHAGFASWLLCQGRTDEALAWSQRARELDPLGISGVSNGWILFQAHRYDDAITELRSALAVRPEDASALWFVGFALTAKGESEEAIKTLNQALALTGGSPGVMGVLVRAYARAGRRAEAFRVLEQLKRRQQATYVPAAAFVNAYLGLDDREQAFAWLERAYQEQSNILQYLKVHPFFDPVRDDPRFQDLVRRVGLTQ